MPARWEGVVWASRRTGVLALNGAIVYWSSPQEHCAEMVAKGLVAARGERVAGARFELVEVGRKKRVCDDRPGCMSNCQSVSQSVGQQHKRVGPVGSGQVVRLL